MYISNTKIPAQIHGRQTKRKKFRGLIKPVSVTIISNFELRFLFKTIILFKIDCITNQNYDQNSKKINNTIQILHVSFAPNDPIDFMHACLTKKNGQSGKDYLTLIK